MDFPLHLLVSVWKPRDAHFPVLIVSKRVHEQNGQQGKVTSSAKDAGRLPSLSAISSCCSADGT